MTLKTIHFTISISILRDLKESEKWSPQQERDRVLVVMDASRSKCGVKALDWAFKHVVRPNDTVIALGVLFECWRKNSCFPFLMGIGISGLCKVSLCWMLTYYASISHVCLSRRRYIVFFFFWMTWVFGTLRTPN